MNNNRRGRIPSRVRYAAFALAVIAVQTAASRAQPLETSAATILSCGPGGASVVFGFSRSKCLYQKAQALGETKDGLAAAAVEVRREELSDPSAYSEANASVTYQIRVVEEQSPPLPSPNLPFEIKYLLQAFADGNSTFASAQIIAGSPTAPASLLSDRVQAFNGISPNPKRTPAFFTLAPGVTTIQVALLAHARAEVMLGEVVQRIARAYVDPQVVFDQQAFDAEYGDDSFPLEDYYSLEFSPGITNRPPSFFDDFESGDTSAWSSATR